MPLSPEAVKCALAMRERGASYFEIADALQTSRATIEYHCIRNGAEPPSPRPLDPRRPREYSRVGVLVRSFTSEEDATLLAMDAQGLSRNKIARALGRPNVSIRYRLMALARRDGRRD